MSGGHFDYEQHNLKNMSDKLTKCLENEEYLDYIADVEKFKKEVNELITSINYASESIHHIDWCISCDTSEETMWERIEKTKERYNK